MNFRQKITTFKDYDINLNEINYLKTEANSNDDARGEPLTIKFCRGLYENKELNGIEIYDYSELNIIKSGFCWFYDANKAQFLVNLNNVIPESLTTSDDTNEAHRYYVKFKDDTEVALRCKYSTEDFVDIYKNYIPKTEPGA